MFIKTDIDIAVFYCYDRFSNLKYVIKSFWYVIRLIHDVYVYAKDLKMLLTKKLSLSRNREVHVDAYNNYVNFS